MTQDLPLVSVVLPAQNASGTILRALNSVAAQTYSHLEIVVVDDASRDDTAALADAWRGCPIRVERLEKNSGVSAARNRGMQLAAGKYIAFLDADDEWLPEKIAAQIAVLEAQPALVFVTCESWQIGSNGRVLGLVNPDRERAVGPDGWKVLLRHPCVATPSVVVRKDLALSLGGFATGLTIAEDQDFWIRLALTGPVANLPRELVRVYDRPESLSRREFRNTAAITLPMIMKHLANNRSRLTPREVRLIRATRYTALGRNAYLGGRIAQGLRLMARAAAMGHEPLANLTYPLIASMPARWAKSHIFGEGHQPFMGKTRVLLISSTFPPVTGGSAVVYENICRCANGAIIGLGASYDYATGRPLPGVAAHDRNAGYSIYRLHMLRPAENRDPIKVRALLSSLVDIPLMLKVLFRVVSIARKEKIDAICLGDLVYHGWLIFPLRYLFRYRILLYVHGEEVTTQDGGGLFDSWRTNFLAHAHAVIAVSSFTRDAMIRLMRTDPDKITLIPNGVNPDMFQPRDPQPDVVQRYGVSGRRVILSVGRLVSRKGFDHLIAAMPAILQACPQAHLLVVGDGPLRDTLATLIHKHGLEWHVTLLGEVTDQALIELYTLADIFALPNREMPDGDTEGFGLVFLEANACGKPVVAGRAGGVVDAVTDGVNGLTVDGNDVGAIAAAVTRLLMEPALYRRLADGGLDAARRSDWRARTVDFMALCERISAGRPRAGDPGPEIPVTDAP